MEEISEGSSDSESVMSFNEGVGPVVISQLPWEALQEIFHHLDGKSLLMCKRVCKNWRDHIHHLEQKASFWYDNCQKEIPSWTQFDLLDNMFPSHWKNQIQVDWEEIYKCWCFWSSLYEAPVSINKFVTGINGISSVKVSGEWVLCTTCEFRGKLTAQRLSGSNLIDIYVGGGAILNFELVTSDRYPRTRVKPVRQLVEIFDTLGHNEIWLELKDCYIQLGKNYCQTFDKIRQKISHSYGYEMRLVSDHNCQDHCSSIILKKICNEVRGPELMELELSSPYFQILDFWMNTISLCGVKCEKEVIFDTVSVNHRTQQVSLSCSLNYNLEGKFCETYCWHGSLFVVYTDKRNIMIHKDGMEKVQVTPIQKGCVTSALFYANHLFLGTDRGLLFIYKVRCPEDCIKIVVYETPSWNIEVCQGRIIHLAIAEPVHHKRKYPVILCGTTQDIYMVSLSA